MTAYADRLATLMPLLFLLAWAAVQDVRTRKIRNWLTLSLAWSGLLGAMLAVGPIGPTQSVMGLLAGFALPFVLFAIGALGGGDVKLLAGVGAWLGPVGVLAVFLLASIVGLVLVLTQSLLQGRVTVLFRNSAVLLLNIRHVGELGTDHLRETGLDARSIDRPLPYAVPVLAGTLIALLLV